VRAGTCGRGGALSARSSLAHSLSLAYAVSFSSLGCALSAGGARSVADAPAAASAPVLRPEFGGWMLAPEEAASDVRELADGRRAFILRGTRWVDHPDGSIERARQIFQEDDVKFKELPPQLGGGFLFYANAGSVTSLWRSETWTSDLTPLGRVEPPVSEVTTGFDRLYLASSTSHVLRAIDARTGEARDLAPLPAAAAYGDMVFADAWRAVVLASVRGALATFDAGETWFSVPTAAAVNELALSPSGAIALGTDAGRFELDAAGHLAQTSARGSDALFAGAETFARYSREVFSSATPAPAPKPLPLGRRPLRAAVLHGWPDTPTTAVVVDQGVVARVRLADGKLLHDMPFAGPGPCRAVALGTGFGFVCGDGRGPTEVYAYHPEGLELDFSLDSARAVRASGNGALVIDAPCEAVHGGKPGRVPAAPVAVTEPGLSRYCVRQTSGALFDVRVRGDVGVERLVALRDGRVAVVIPPRSNAPGRLSLLSATGSTSTELTLTPADGPGARLVRSGLWLDELWEVEPGQLGEWVVGAQAFVGIRIDLAGKVQIARLQDGVDETSFFGPFAAHVAGSAGMRETTDYGFDWRASDLPPALLSSPVGASAHRPVRGCSAVGCVYDDWVRIGFSGEEGVPDLVRPEPPRRAVFPGFGFAFWNLECAPGPVTTAARRAAAVRSVAARASSPRVSASSSTTDQRESSAWLSFQGEPPPPERPPTALGYDFGETNENGAYRGYAWGPVVGDWSRRGLWQLRIGDRFSVDPPWSTGISRSPWPDAAAAAQTFGLDPNTGVDWWLRLGATGRSGVLQIRVRSESSIHLIDGDRSITTLEPGSASDVGTVAGAYEVGDVWYLGTVRAEQFQLFRIERSKPVLLQTYPLWGRVVTQLVRSVHEDELAIWQKSSGSGWYLYPIDLSTFEARPALTVPVDHLGMVPPACEPGQPGWIVTAGVPLTDSAVSESNTHLDFSGKAEGLRTKRLTAKVVIDERGVCVDSLAALSDGTLPARELEGDERPSRGSLPLTVTDPADDRRWPFRCARP
jgi:hypothetical protein